MTPLNLFVLDEHLRRTLWFAITKHNQTNPFPIDAVRVGDPVDLPLGTKDPQLLKWAEKEGRILVSRDVHTLSKEFADHLQHGNHSPGVFLLAPSASSAKIVEYLMLASYVGQPSEYFDVIKFIPD